MKNKLVNLSLSEKQHELGVKFRKTITIKELYFLGLKMINDCDRIRANWELIMDDITPKFKELKWIKNLSKEELENFIDLLEAEKMK